MEGGENWMGDPCRGLWMEIDGRIGGKKVMGGVFDGHEEDEKEKGVRRGGQRPVDIKPLLVVI